MNFGDIDKLRKMASKLETLILKRGLFKIGNYKV